MDPSPLYTVLYSHNRFVALQYVNRATSSLRSAMKEPARMKALQQEVFAYNSTQYVNGESEGKVPVENMAHPAAPDHGI